jgi:hypothetical protein
MSREPHPTPARWPGAVRSGNVTHIYPRDDNNNMPVTTLVTTNEPTSYLCDEYTEYVDESYASLTREYYTHRED